MSRHEHGITTPAATVVTQILLAKSSIRNILRKEMSPRSLPQNLSLPVCWETTLLGRKPYAAEKCNANLGTGANLNSSQFATHHADMTASLSARLQSPIAINVDMTANEAMAVRPNLEKYSLAYVKSQTSG